MNKYTTLMTFNPPPERMQHATHIMTHFGEFHRLHVEDSRSRRFFLLMGSGRLHLSGGTGAL
jgi:hypothetical protein